jgi:signal transduction histidine kinase
VLTKVRDTGCGIAPEHLGRLGERFYRADMSRTRDDGGTGLGLAIASGIVVAHGGKLQFDSAIGVGTEVSVYLPAV